MFLPAFLLEPEEPCPEADGALDAAPADNPGAESSCCFDEEAVFDIADSETAPRRLALLAWGTGVVELSDTLVRFDFLEEAGECFTLAVSRAGLAA